MHVPPTFQKPALPQRLHRLRSATLLPVAVSLAFLCVCSSCVLVRGVGDYVTAPLPKDHWWRHYKEGRSREQIIKDYDLRLKRYWNHYFRGALFEKGEFYQDAIRDFDGAIAARFDDERNVRTYGMHFIDYFPHREKGVCLYRLGRVDEAEKELRQSLSTAASVKAQRYLKALVRSKVGRNLPPPTIVLISPAQPRVPSRDVEIKGTVQAPAYVDWFAVDDDRRDLDAPDNTHEFTRSLSLKDGPNTVTLRTRDLAGREATRTLDIWVDTKPPVLAVFTDRCVVEDDSGLQSMKINGEPAAPDHTDSDGAQVFTVPSAGPLTIEAVDVVGHASPVYTRTPPGSTPFVELDLEDDIVVHDPTFAVGGRAYHELGIDRILIGDDPVKLPDGKPKEVYFSGLLRLDEGLNLVKVEANTGGSELTCKRCVTLKPFVLFDKESRLRVAVMPPVLRGVPEAFAIAFHEKLGHALTKRFNMLERERFSYEHILQTLQQRRLPLTDQKPDYVKILRTDAIPADALLFVILTNPEAAKNVEVDAYLMETATTRTLLDTEDYGLQQDLDELVDRLCARICRQFPALVAAVTQVQKKSARLHAGQRHGLKPGMTLRFYRERDIFTGAETLKQYEPVHALGRIASTDGETSHCQVAPPEGKEHHDLDDTCVGRTN